MGFAGIHCEVDVNECASNPCDNGATCFDSTTSSDVAVHAYRCVCAPGFGNGLCEYDFISEYAAECSVMESGASLSVGGGNCEIDVDECASSPCENNATCTDSVSESSSSAGRRLQTAASCFGTADEIPASCTGTPRKRLQRRQAAMLLDPNVVALMAGSGPIVVFAITYM